MGGLVAGLFQHSHGMTLTDYCFHSVSDVYVPLDTSQPALSGPGPVPQRGPCVGASSLGFSMFFSSARDWPRLAMPSGQGTRSLDWNLPRSQTPFLTFRTLSDLYPECGASLTPRAAGGLVPMWSLRGPMSGLLPQEGSLASRGSPRADAPFPLQQSVRLSCRRGAHVLIRSDSHCLLFFCFFLHLVLCFNACCNFY